MLLSPPHDRPSRDGAGAAGGGRGVRRKGRRGNKNQQQQTQRSKLNDGGESGNESIVLAWWNARHIKNKESNFKEFLHKRGAIYGGVSESRTYKDDNVLSDKRWRWEACAETQPSPTMKHPPRGLGAFTDVERTKASLVFSGKYTCWHRIELGGEHAPLFVCCAYFPLSKDIRAHKKANAELRERLVEYSELGFVVAGGDFNCHTGLNGDTTPVDVAGRMFMETADKVPGMVIVNSLDLCRGGPTRVQVLAGEIQQSTLDYVICSESLINSISSLIIEPDQMDSDHKPLTLTISGLRVARPTQHARREVWKIDDIPSPPDNWSWVHACQSQFKHWIRSTGNMLSTMEAIDAETTRVADLLDWSFQNALDEVAHIHLGTKTLHPKPTPGLDGATRLLIQHRQACEYVLKRAMHDEGATSEDKTMARTHFLAASKAIRLANSRKRELAELSLFRDVEAKQGNSKLFWKRVKVLRATCSSTKAPPPIVFDDDGGTITDPLEVLRTWRKFSAKVASTSLEGTSEEGIYDEDYQSRMRDHLDNLHKVKVDQGDLDHPIDADEVFRAIRKLKCGKSPGEDGLLTDILKTAADAVNNSKLRGRNTVVEGLTLLFNYVLSKEIWPARWSTGIIFPLYKHESRLEPSNYRPITLLSVVGKLFGRIINERLLAWSERTGMICDEQGGFRPMRGAPDQIFLLREILTSRKERNLPTYTTFIDARKAYDTVWREAAFVRIHEGGVRGKLWRQLQVMNSGLTRRVRHPLGTTDPFPIERGVAQGAVESPWIYSCFINDLAAKLKSAGHGIWVAGRRVALLMYADDVVLLANNANELGSMNKIATNFARLNRFQYNGEKSAVMVFNVDGKTRENVRKTSWSLFGEEVMVKDSYQYLGTATHNNMSDWGPHVKAQIAKAIHRSADLLWICRHDAGIRPRTAVTLWNSLVRPLLEYASEVWSGLIGKEVARKAERVQTEFLRAVVGLHKNGSGVSDHVLRAELGCETLESRWAKLRLGYWRRVQDAPVTRLLKAVASFRYTEINTPNNGGLGARSSLRPTHDALVRFGLASYWQNPALCLELRPDKWKRLVYDRVNAEYDNKRADTMSLMSSAAVYNQVKSWGVNEVEYSKFSGEVGRLGFLTPERYLDDRTNIKGTRLKMLCRLACLPVMDRVGREVRPKWPKENRVCWTCEDAHVEDVRHFVMDCTRYDAHRTVLLAKVCKILESQEGEKTFDDFNMLTAKEQFEILMGKRIGNPQAEDTIDKYVKTFLVKCWGCRRAVEDAVNNVLNTNYSVFGYKVQRHEPLAGG